MRILFLVLIFSIQSCATYMQDKIGEEFKSIQPDFSNFENINDSTEGAVYTGDGGLFASDRRANRVGDIITITLEETMAAANAGSETTAKSDAYTFDLPEAIFGPSSLIAKLFFPDGVKEDNLRGGTTQAFTGTGTAAQSNSMTGTISVTIVRVFPNGNLEVKGQRKLTYNSGTEYVRLSGVVRPDDISSSNTVSSKKVADAQISYTGTGDMNDSVTKGWLSRYFAYVSPF
ncbi:MAG: flagellar basal body L-ring protein FlgH [Pseudomonadota bacterium]|nr:flagellar basal body L-ring protein FlgH [Pseudomonadota bacterium]